MIVWSYGGGVQSAGIAVLIRQGRLPKPDLAVIADTGRERKTTWSYLREVIAPYLAPIGLEIQTAPHTLSRVDVWTEDGDMLMPAYTEAGRLPTWCAGEWKRAVCERWLRSQGVKECDCWIGYSMDEMRRMTKDHRPWCHLQYPLIDLRVTRGDCFRLCETAGLPRPPKSRCWQCPHQTNEEWRQVREDPEEWAAAVALDRQIRERDEQGGLYLHSSRVPLDVADLSDPPELPLFRGCDGGGGCWT